MQALLAFFFFKTGLVILTVSGMSVRLRLTVVVVVIVAVMVESGWAEGVTACGEGAGRMSIGEGGRAGDSRCCCMSSLVEDQYKVRVTAKKPSIRLYRLSYQKFQSTNLHIQSTKIILV